MKEIKVRRDQLPSDWTETHIRFLETGHKRGALTFQGRTRKACEAVVGWASRWYEVGLSVFGGLVWVDMHGRHGNGAVRFRVVDA